MKKRNFSEKFKVEDLYLASILRYDGMKKFNSTIIKDWTFVTYVIIYKNEDNGYFNVMNNNEKYYKLSSMSQIDTNEEVVDIIGGANLILKTNIKVCTKDYILNSIEKSDLFFRDVQGPGQILEDAPKKKIKTIGIK